ncbi:MULTISPECIES: hypothetical protein [unclassified Pseudomonas]|uniref:hypothetical protein n=1 Tax=unclassified Pseudomonas TaxID=196821 RepID=UPI0014833FD9|nr:MULTISPECIES: hypothetical protein [unclassified Pseudomonas]
MTDTAAVVKREPQVAIVPLNAIDIQDVASSAATLTADVVSPLIVMTRSVDCSVL